MKEKIFFVMLADGFEEVEALGTVDVLRRLGCAVKTVGLNDRSVVSSRKISVNADTDLTHADFSEACGIVLPGGLPGATNLRDNATLTEHIRNFANDGKLLAAICAAPIVLKAAGVAEKRALTGYPGCEPLSGADGLHFTGAMVERDGNIITGKGPGATFLFAAEIARASGVPEQKIQDVLKGMFVC